MVFELVSIFDTTLVQSLDASPSTINKFYKYTFKTIGCNKLRNYEITEYSTNRCTKNLKTQPQISAK